MCPLVLPSWRFRGRPLRLVPELALVILLALPACTDGTGRHETLPTSGVATPPPASPAPSPSPSAPVRWHVTVRRLPPAVRDGMVTAGAWHQGCPAPLGDLRLVRLSYRGFDGEGHVGKLVVNRDAAPAITSAMHALWRARFPIRRMVPVEAFGASDERSMEADNTSAFNCRPVEGTDVWSQHAYGRAIDINPRENPEVQGAVVLPRNAGEFVDRSRHRKGMVSPGDVVVRAFTAVGWGWGGSWHSLKDWQHFSANGL